MTEYNYDYCTIIIRLLYNKLTILAQLAHDYCVVFLVIVSQVTSDCLAINYLSITL